MSDLYLLTMAELITEWGRACEAVTCESEMGNHASMAKAQQYQDELWEEFRDRGLEVLKPW